MLERDGMGFMIVAAVSIILIMPPHPQNNGWVA